MDAPLIALKHLGVDFEVLAGSDPWKPAQAFWRHHHGSTRCGSAPGSTIGTMYDDLTTRNHKEAIDRHGHPMLYVAGFPCPTFSTAGLRRGAAVAQGQIIVHIIAFLRVAVPGCFLLENVCGLLSDHPETLKWILQELRKLPQPYVIDMRCLNSSDHVIPQNRNRVWILGLRKDVIVRPFTWPCPWGHLDLGCFLDPVVGCATLDDLPTQWGARRNLLLALKQIATQFKVNPLRRTFVVKVDNSQKWGPKWMDGMVNCMTCQTKNGQWLTDRGRRMTCAEMARLSVALHTWNDNNIITFIFQK